MDINFKKEIDEARKELNKIAPVFSCKDIMQSLGNAQDNIFRDLKTHNRLYKIQLVKGIEI